MVEEREKRKVAEILCLQLVNPQRDIRQGEASEHNPLLSGEGVNNYGQVFEKRSLYGH
jgi:hypothetical protein